MWKEKSRIRGVQATLNSNGKYDTKPQIALNDMLDKLKINYENEHDCKYYAIDNFLIDYNLMIEVMGDYWHYSPIEFKGKSPTAIQERTSRRDKVKHKYIYKYYGVEVLYLWETDILKDKEKCLLLINQYIKNNGVLKSYHSFNYSCIDGSLSLNNNIIEPFN